MERLHRPPRPIRHRLVSALAGLALLAALPAITAAASEQHPHAEDRVIVGFDQDASRLERRRAVRAPGVVSAVAASPIAPDVVVVELREGTSVAAAVDDIGAQPGVAYVEPDYRLRTAAASDDPRYVGGDQWGMYGDATSPHANPFGSGAGEAWADGHIGSTNVYVGVIDEGVKLTHPDLTGNIWHNPWETANGIDDDGNGYVDDINGWDFYHDDASVYDSTADDHGTHVAGTIGARGGNGLGGAGVNWRVTLIPVKFLGPGGGYASDAVRAIDYITDLKTRHRLGVIATNNSWTGGGFSQAVHDAIARAGDAGILFVAAAGNDGQDIGDAPAYPASYHCDTRADGTARGWDCLVAVANLGPDGDRHPTSNWGAADVDLGAPGTDIISTDPDGDDGYAHRTGTSMATPHVSGAIALCASLEPSLSAHRIRELLLAAATPTESLADRTSSGSRLDVGALAASCAPALPPSPGQATTLDDLDEAFRRFGSDWNEGLTGHGGHHFWVPTRDAKRTVYGAWKPLLASAGWYDVLVFVPLEHATSRRATYRVKTATGWVTRIRNQKKRQGTWVSLGIHRLTTTPIVQLSDKTGEPSSLGRQLAFDTASFVPVAGPPMD